MEPERLIPSLSHLKLQTQVINSRITHPISCHFNPIPREWPTQIKIVVPLLIWQQIRFSNRPIEREFPPLHLVHSPPMVVSALVSKARTKGLFDPVRLQAELQLPLNPGGHWVERLGIGNETDYLLFTIRNPAWTDLGIGAIQNTLDERFDLSLGSLP